MKILLLLLLAIALHALLCIGLGYSVVFLVLSGPDLIDGWRWHWNLLLKGLSRIDLHYYTINIVACIVAVPLINGVCAAVQLAGGGRPQRWIVMASAGTFCLVYIIVLRLLLPAIAPGRLTVIASISFGFISVVIMVSWSILAVPLALAANRLLAGLSNLSFPRRR